MRQTASLGHCFIAQNPTFRRCILNASDMRKLLVVILFSTVALAYGQIEQGVLLGRWSVDSLVGSSAFNNTYNEIWGLAHDGREYAIIGSTYGTHFIDVTNPENPVEVYQVEGGTSGPAIIHRDYHDYAGYLYAVADEGRTSSLQIFDYSFLPDSVATVFDDSQLLRRSHNIFIDTTSALLYSCLSEGDTLPRTAMRIIDISDPVAPEFVAEYAELNGYRFSQVHDIYVDQDTAILNLGPFGWIIAAFDDPRNPSVFSIFSPNDYPQAGYNHSGYRTADKKHYILADENWNLDMKVYNIEDPMNVDLVALLDAGTDSTGFSIPHNQLVLDDYLYVSYYYDGLQVYDLSDINNIRRIMEYKTTQIPHRRNYEGCWGVYPYLPSGNILLSDMQDGLFVLAPVDQVVSNEDEPEIVSDKLNIYPNPSRAGDLVTIISPEEITINTTIAFRDATGRIVYQNTLRNNQVVLPDLAPGLYTVTSDDFSASLLVIE